MKMTQIERAALMERMAALEREMQLPERGQTTFESLRNAIATLADVVWCILDDAS